MAALAAEKDVFDVVETGSDSLAFRLSLDGVEREEWPSFSVDVTTDLDGVPTLGLSTGYAEGLFERDASSQLRRARSLVARLTEECTGVSPALGKPKPCGAGAPHDLCVHGR
jgi:hypothetical protein